MSRIEDEAPMETSAPAAAPPPGPPILIVDDDPAVRGILTVILESEGFATARAVNGEEALAALAAQPAALVLLDLMMPVKDGWAFLRDFQTMPGPRPPVIVVSARWGTTQRLLARQLGVAEYVEKPFDVRDLVGKVRQHVASTPDDASLFH
jgi:DNA-binding response OmpR family regulator